MVIGEQQGYQKSDPGADRYAVGFPRQTRVLSLISNGFLMYRNNSNFEMLNLDSLILLREVIT